MQPITDKQIELIKAAFAETGSIRAASRAAGVSVATASKYVKASDRDQFEQIRTRKRVDIIEAIGDAKVKLIEAMTDAAHLTKASVQELATAFGILQDKELLLNGQATSRTAVVTDDPMSRLTPEEIEQAKRIRAKLAAEAVR